MRDAQVRRCAVTATVLVETPNAVRTPSLAQGSSISAPAAALAAHPALSLRNVGKSYDVGGRSSTTLGEQVAEWVGRARASSDARMFWALQSVSCEIGKEIGRAHV